MVWVRAAVWLAIGNAGFRWDKNGRKKTRREESRFLNWVRVMA